MPGDTATYDTAVDLYPRDETEYAALRSWCLRAFTAAENARQTRTNKWLKYHRLYSSYIAGESDDWRSRVFIPYTFSIIEGIVPKMLAEPPKLLCIPIGPEDVGPAKLMETLLDYHVRESQLFVQLILVTKSALKYGTGILKNFYEQDIKFAWEMVPKLQPAPGSVEPVTNPETGTPAQAMDGGFITDQAAAPADQMVPVLDANGQPVMERRRYAYVAYDGPKSEWVDVFNFFVAPEATSMEDARYVVQRMWRDQDEIAAKIDTGMYHLPPGMNDVTQLWSSQENDPQNIRQSEVGKDQTINDETRKPCELREFWTKDGRVITVANRVHILRCQQNPFWHGQKPFSRVVDYLQEGEFWGVGEVESIEGLQDILNVIINQRIDNVRFAMDKMVAVKSEAIEDERELVRRPGGVVRVAGEFLPQEAFYEFPAEDITQSAFVEAEFLENLVQRITGVTDYALGLPGNNLNRTATGVALITESGATKFAMKVMMLEHVGLHPMATQWGSILQQFTTEDRFVRMLGPAGEFLFASLSPESIQGALDYSVSPASSTQTETVRKEQAMSLAQAISALWPQANPKLVQDLLEANGVKDFAPYLFGMPDLMLQLQMQQAQQTAQAQAQGVQPQPGQPGQQQAPPGQAANQPQQQNGQQNGQGAPVGR